MSRPCFRRRVVLGFAAAVTLLSILAAPHSRPACAGEVSGGGDDPPAAARSLVFSGLEWTVKASASGVKLGPGPNFWSASGENVWVDEQGRLHLRTTKRPGEDGRARWFCAEVVSKKSFGFGEYRWQVDSPLKADPRVVLGLFTWDDDPESERFHHREIDIELVSTWGEANSTNAQFCVQPWTTRRNRHRFALAEPSLAATTHMFSWRKDSVLFRSLRGHPSQSARQASVLEEWKLSGSAVPPPGGERVRMNLWLLSRPTDDSSEEEVILSSFEFVPQPPVTGDAFGLEITEVPPASLRPGPLGTGRIAGRVTGIRPAGCKIVVFAKSDKWYVQPLVAAPDTAIAEDGCWSARTHGGDEYAAILAAESYEAPPTVSELPLLGGPILGVARGKPGR